MNDVRPNPDVLLRQVQTEERKAARGKLTIYFGAAPGVGKTFAMLEEASYKRDVERADVVAGVVETHGRFETTTLLAGFELLPSKEIEYRGRALEEFDLDGALERHPQLLLVDELAHTNADGSRHPKRWQDVEELLDAGIDVFTTLNVQHVESLNDVVAQITGVRVRETVPDSILDDAQEIKLIDLPPEKLLERLREGKVYVPAQAQRALENFFRKGNLIALRELALRRTAERVDAEMDEYRRAHGIEQTWGASDHLLVCISPSPYSADLLRTGRRMAAGLRARWFAVMVETPQTLRLPAADRARVSTNLRLAEQLGAETVTLTGEHAAGEILGFAREHDVTKIVVGKPRARRWRDRLTTPFVDELILGSGSEIDVFVTAGESEARGPSAPRARREQAEHAGGYAAAAGAIALATALSALVFGRSDLPDVVMIFLLGVVMVSIRFGRRAAVLAAALAVLAFDFFFTPPYYTFTVADLRYVVTFGVMLVVALIVTGLTQRVRDQAQISHRTERRTAMLYAMSRELARTQGQNALIHVATSHIETALECKVMLFQRGADGALALSYATPGLPAPSTRELGLASWVWSNRREAGHGTSTVPAENGFFLPLVASSSAADPIGVLGLIAENPERFSDPEQQRLADAFAAQMAMALERATLATETEHARVAVETERLRSTLLSSVSHDLRTPLAVMKGAATTLADDGGRLARAKRRELLDTLIEETNRLERLIQNVLDMTRLESGSVVIKKEWQAVEEVVGAALNRVEILLGNRPVTTRVPGDLLAPFDAVLIEQLLVNLLENAAKHTPPGTAIEVAAHQLEGEVEVEVADHGPGLPPGEEQRVFDKFHRTGPNANRGPGVGLGLAICRAIVLAHGGRIQAGARPGGGASFRFTIPLEGLPPAGGLPELVEE
jgi:two-component system, OmpR family, sensor histidine kinase KdpD